MKKKLASLFRQKKIHFGIFLFLPLLIGLFRNQMESSSQADCVYRQVCELTQRSYFEFSEDLPPDNRHLLALLSARERVERKRVETCVDQAGLLTTTIEILNPEEIYKSWMSRVGKVVIEPGQITLFDLDGHLIRTDALEKNQKELLETLGSYGAPPRFEWHTLTPAQIQDLENQGFTVWESEPGNFTIANDSTRLIINEPALTVEKQRLQAGALKSSIRQSFAALEKGIVPVSTVSRSFQNLPGGYCGAAVMETFYHQHDRFSPEGSQRFTNADSSVYRKRESGHLLEKNEADPSAILVVYPNPGFDQLTILLPVLPFSENQQITILDQQGRQKMDLGTHVGGKVVKLDISDFLSGTYLVRVQAGNSVFTHTILKP